MARLVSLSVLTTLIVILGITFFRVIAPFILPLFVAAIAAILCQPLYRYFIERTEGRFRLAAGLTTASVLAIILVPLTLGIVLASLQLFSLATELSTPDSKIHHQIQEVRSSAEARLETIVATGLDLMDRFQPPPEVGEGELTEEELAELRTERRERLMIQARTQVREGLLDIGRRSVGIAGKTLSGTLGLIVGAIIGILMFAIALYYFLADGTAMIAATERLVPVHAAYQRELLAEFAKVVRAVVMATFLAAIAQGVATTFALAVFGFRHLFVLFIVTTIGALVPLAGTWLIWGPCAIWLFLDGHPIQATLLTVWGIGVVGMMDNIIRTWVLNSDTKLHPLLAFISVLGGIQAMGLWGVFVGPIVASCLHALVKIFNHEVLELSRERFGIVPGPASDGPTKLEEAEAARPDESASPISPPPQSADPPDEETRPASPPEDSSRQPE